MKAIVSIVWVGLAVVAIFAVAAAQSQTFDTSAGAVKITPLYHASTVIEAGGRRFI